MIIKSQYLQSDIYPIRDFTFLDEVKAEIQNNILTKPVIYAYNQLINIPKDISKTSCAYAMLGLVTSRVSRLSSVAVLSFKIVTIFALIGSVYALSSSIFLHHRSDIARKERIRAFTQLQDIPDTVQKQISFVKEFIQLHHPCLGQTFQNHYLHHVITEITLAVKNNEKASSSWKKALETLNGMQVYYPDQTKHVLNFSDTSIEQQRLKGVRCKVKTEMLDRTHPKFSTDLKQIEDLLRDCFGIDNDRSLMSHLPWKAYLSKRRWEKKSITLKLHLSNFIVARDESSNKILGVIQYSYKDASEKIGQETHKKSFYIDMVGRDPGAVGLGIGKLMFNQLKNHLPEICEIKLHVRKSNQDAIMLYLDQGFKIENTEKSVYEHPREDGLEMKLIRHPRLEKKQHSF